MSNIKTITEELEEISADIEKSMIGGDYDEIVDVLKKLVKKVDEIVIKLNEEK